MPDDENRAEAFTAVQKGRLPDHLGLQWAVVRNGLARGGFIAGPQHMAPNGYLHAASVIALADTACGYGCLASLPAGAESFTTLELKANFLGTAREGERVACEARLAHGGRTTQVWDAEVRLGEGGKTIALFRCTQLALYPKPA
jgi:1,4-dihydroxy-2-naphthoyl-CoA hydrolase